MAADKSKSLIMAQRLKNLRTERGLSHESLKKALMEKYEIDISIDSLKNYEVSKAQHAKAYKNEGMRVEYLRCLADFYGVSADYILGADVPMNPDISVREIVEKTGLSEENVASLIAWMNLPIISQIQDGEGLTDIEKNVIDKASRIGSPDFARYICINLIRKLISAVTDRADVVCDAFDSYALCVFDARKYKKYKMRRVPKSIAKETYMDLEKQGYRIVPAHDVIRLKWEDLSEILHYGINRSLLRDIERREAANGND